MPDFSCPHCAEDSTHPRELAGLIVSCPKCGQDFIARNRAGGSRVVRDRTPGISADGVSRRRPADSFDLGWLAVVAAAVGAMLSVAGAFIRMMTLARAGEVARAYYREGVDLSGIEGRMALGSLLGLSGLALAFTATCAGGVGWAYFGSNSSGRSWRAAAVAGFFAGVVSVFSIALGH